MKTTSAHLEGARVLLVDDLIATGGTIRAAAELIGKCGATVDGIFAVIGLPFLNYQNLLTPYRVETLIEYPGDSLPRD